MTQRIIVAGVAFVLLFLLGIWLNRSGKPYSTLVLTVHKLVGLGLGVLLAAIVYQTHQVAPLGGLEIAVIVVTGLFFVGTVAADGLLSIDKPAPAFVATLHLVVPILTVLSTGGTLYLLPRSI
jgi:hypothetical protein